MSKDWKGEDVWLGALPLSTPAPTPALTASPTHNPLRPGIAAVPGIISVAMLRSFGTHLVQLSATESGFQTSGHSSCPLALPH